MHCGQNVELLYGEVNAVKKKHNYKTWLNDGIY